MLKYLNSISETLRWKKRQNQYASSSCFAISLRNNEIFWRIDVPLLWDFYPLQSSTNGAQSTETSIRHNTSPHTALLGHTIVRKVVTLFAVSQRFSSNNIQQFYQLNCYKETYSRIDDNIYLLSIEPEVNLFLLKIAVSNFYST